MRLRLSSPVAAAVPVAIAYLAWAGWYTHYHRVDTLVHVSSFFQSRADTSAPIKRLVPTAGNTVGYDGQFYAFIATDPVGARPYLDNPAYRYSRPVYPLLAGAAAGWNPDVVPWTLLALGILGVAAATFALATIARSRGVSPWYGALAGAYPGLFLAVSNDLAESLAYGLLCLGLMAWTVGGRRLVVASLLFGIAGATRETTLIFPLVLCCWLAFRERRVRDGLQVALIALAPYVLIKVGLAVWLGSWGYARATQLAHLPFLGLVRQWPWNDYHVQQIMAVVAPALLALFVTWYATRRASVELWFLVVNVLILVVFLPGPSYVGYLASGRIATGVVIAFALCLPAVLERGKTAQAWLPIVLWMLPWYTLLPVALRR
jgi:hypothetical protein